ncbi:MAG: sn-glycerol-3-phosphate ABC transporter ATP-binding protein UgpC [Rubrivivax sp.]|nr:sn-glycerol-3-phosphate ABC transporter ATP-binding protein UgpC [Rubrivivax sp.]
MAAVSLKGITKSYDGKTDVLRDISLDIADGEFVVLVGPSGCGKSTLLRMLCGLESATAGEIAIGGRVVNHLPPAQRGIAMVFQSYALYPHMNVYRNMAFGLKVSGADRTTIDTRIRQAAKTLQIEHLLERLPRELSGGQRQRVAIGRAIVREPQLFLFDEPLSNLDAALRVQTRLELARLHRQLAATIVYVTHDQVEAMTLGDTIVVMHEGRIQQAGSPLALYQTPVNRFVATFIGSPKMNLLPARVLQASASGVRCTLPGRLDITAEVDGSALKPGDEVTLGLRPEHAQSGEGPERFSGRIDMVEHLGEVNLLYVTLDGGQELVVRSDGDAPVRIGDPIVFHAERAAFHLFDADGRAARRLKPGNLLAARRLEAA